MAGIDAAAVWVTVAAVPPAYGRRDEVAETLRSHGFEHSSEAKYWVTSDEPRPSPFGAWRSTEDNPSTDAHVIADRLAELGCTVEASTEGSAYGDKRAVRVPGVGEWDGPVDRNGGFVLTAEEAHEIAALGGQAADALRDKFGLDVHDAFAEIDRPSPVGPGLG